MAEPKIVTMYCGWDVRVKPIDNGLAIIADDKEETDACICLDRANARLLHEALGRAINTGEG